MHTFKNAMIPFKNFTSKRLILGSVLLHLVFAFELFNPASGIYQFLFPGKKGMTTGTNIQFDITNGRFGHKGVATGTSYRCHHIFRMNSLLQRSSPL